MERAKALGCSHLKIDGLDLSFGSVVPSQASDLDIEAPRKGAIHPFPTSGSPEKGADREHEPQTLMTAGDRQAARETYEAQLLIDDPAAFEQLFVDASLERERKTHGEGESR